MDHIQYNPTSSMHYEKAEGYFNFIQYYDMVANRLRDGAIIVEVGVYMGKSALFLAERLQQLSKRVDFHLVDNFQGGPDYNISFEALWAQFNVNINPLKNLFHVNRLDSVVAARFFLDNSLDYVFIDAGHDYDNVRDDIKAWLPQVKKGGYLAGHDMHHKPVQMAVAEAFPEGVMIYPGTVWEITKKQ